MVTNNLALADYDLLRWIPLIPLLAAVSNLFWGRALGRKTAGALACAAVGASFVLAFYVFWQGFWQQRFLLLRVLGFLRSSEVLRRFAS